MKTKIFLIFIVSGFFFSTCKKDNDEIKEPIFENGILNLKAFTASLPPYAKVMVEHPSESSDAYFKVDLSNAGSLDGKWPGWCIQTGTGIKPGVKNTARVYSSYASLSDYNEGFLIRLNWVISQKFVEQGFTYGEVQIALWSLQHGYIVFNEDVAAELYDTRPPDPFDPKSIGEWDAEKINEILTLASGITDFIPYLGGLIGIIIIDEKNQDLVIEYTLPSK